MERHQDPLETLLRVATDADAESSRSSNGADNAEQSANGPAMPASVTASEPRKGPAPSLSSPDMSKGAATARREDSEPAASRLEHPPAKRRRTNTTRACDRCKEKKQKCDGQKPCRRCGVLGEGCSYNAPYTRGSPPPPIIIRPDPEDQATPAASSPARPPIKRKSSKPGHTRNVTHYSGTREQERSNGWETQGQSPSYEKMDLDNESGSPDGNTASEHGTESSNQAARGNRRPSNPIRKDPVESNGNGSKQQRTSSRSPSGSRESSVGAIEHGHHESFLGDSSGLAFSHAARLHLSSQRDEESFSPIISLATSPTLDADQPQNRHRPSITEKQKGDDIAKTTDSTARGTGDCEGKPAYPPGSYQPTFRRQQDDATSATSSSGPPRSRYSSAFTVENAGNGDEQYRRSQKEFRQSPTPTPRGSMDDFNAHFWFSENPLPPLDIATFTLPSKAKALEMSKWYFENATPTYRILHRPTIEACIESGLHAEDEDMDAQVRVRGGDIRDKIMRDKSVCAVVFMVWAIGCQYPLGKAVHDDTEAQVLREKSIKFYQCAQLQLEKEMSQIDRLATLQARLLMCIYLLTVSRLKASWDLFAVVKNMANSLDLNKCRSHHIACLDPIHLEMRRRAMWAIYTLDTYMCTMLGKTLAWDDGDITVEYPSLADDWRITPNGITMPTVEEEEESPSLMHAPLAHAKLAKIIRLILRKLYNDRQPDVELAGKPSIGSTSERTNNFILVDSLASMISKWEEELPYFLKTRSSGSLLHIYARQSSVIQLAHAHALIMLYRPSLPLSNLARNADNSRGHNMTLAQKQAIHRSLTSKSVYTPGPTQAEILVDESAEDKIKRYQDNCVGGGRRVTGLVTMLTRKDTITGPFWFTAYLTFCAATVMFVYLAHYTDSPKRVKILDAANKCLTLEKKLSFDNRMARRYVAALEGLSRQVQEVGKKTDGVIPTASSSSPSDHGKQAVFIKPNLTHQDIFRLDKPLLRQSTSYSNLIAAPLRSAGMTRIATTSGTAQNPYTRTNTSSQNRHGSIHNSRLATSEALEASSMHRQTAGTPVTSASSPYNNLATSLNNNSRITSNSANPSNHIASPNIDLYKAASPAYSSMFPPRLRHHPIPRSIPSTPQLTNSSLTPSFNNNNAHFAPSPSPSSSTGLLFLNSGHYANSPSDHIQGYSNIPHLSSFDDDSSVQVDLNDFLYSSNMSYGNPYIVGGGGMNTAEEGNAIMVPASPGPTTTTTSTSASNSSDPTTTTTTATGSTSSSSDPLQDTVNPTSTTTNNNNSNLNTTGNLTATTPNSSYRQLPIWQSMEHLESMTFQGLDATASGGWMFGSPQGPVY